MTAKNRPASLQVFQFGAARFSCNGAGDGNRTRTSSLEGYSSTIELLPPGDTFRLRLEDRADLRQTRSYRQKILHKTAKNSWWREVDSNHRRHEPADLQSAPV